MGSSCRGYHDLRRGVPNRPLRRWPTFHQDHISVCREKALGFSGCDCRAARGHVPGGRNRSRSGLVRPPRPGRRKCRADGPAETTTPFLDSTISFAEFRKDAGAVKTTVVSSGWVAACGWGRFLGGNFLAGGASKGCGDGGHADGRGGSLQRMAHKKERS